MSSKNDPSIGQQYKLARHNKNLVRRFYREAWDQDRLAVISELFAFKHITHSTAPTFAGALARAEDMKQLLKTFRRAIPDMRVSIEDILADRDRVAVRYVIEGTHQGELFGLAPSQTTITLNGMAIHQLSHEKIVESWLNQPILPALVPA